METSTMQVNDLTWHLHSGMVIVSPNRLLQSTQMGRPFWWRPKLTASPNVYFIHHEWMEVSRQHDHIIPFFYACNLFSFCSESFPRTNPLFLGAMTNMQAVLLDTESSLLIVGSSLCVGDEREEDPLLTGQTLGKLDPKDLPICKSSTWIAEISIMGPCLCFNSQRGEDPPLSDQSVGQEEQRDMQVRKLLTCIAGVSIMGTRLCLDFKQGKGPPLTDQGVGGWKPTNLPVHTL